MHTFINIIVIALHLIAAISLLFASVTHPQAGYGLIVLGATALGFVSLTIDVADMNIDRDTTYRKGMAKLSAMTEAN